jgi:UPF0755 protein
MIRFVKGALVGLLVALGATAFMLAYVNSPANGNDGPRTFSIQRGDNATAVAMRLREQGFIRSPSYFLLAATLGEQTTSLMPGRYTISGSMSARDILARLAFGNPEESVDRVTFPEGMTAEEVALRLEEFGLCDADEFMAVAEAPEAHGIDTRGIYPPTLEGFLFPDTYFIDEQSTCKLMAKRMTAEFFKKFGPAESARAAELGMSPLEVVTLASLVEKEARLTSERGLISGVIHNRLKAKMMLQIDATVQYALPERKERLLYKDLEVDSPYNTYKRAGLPPGPICNPGTAAIRAALYPEESDYLYYVARGDGGHTFNRTFDEHVRSKRGAGR